MADLPWTTGPDEDARSVGVTERKCRRHAWERVVARMDLNQGGAITAGIEPWTCARCGKTQDPEKSRRGKSARRRGNDAERTIAKLLGGKRTGQYGGPDDVTVGEMFAIQSKVGPGWFRESYHAELAKLPRTGGRIPLLIVSDAPGPGRRTRRMVVLTIEDWLALHGEAA